MATNDRQNPGTALNLSGLAVSLLVAVLSVLTALGEPLFVPVLLVTIAELACFSGFMLLPPEQRRKLVILLWLQAVTIIALYFLVYHSLLGILGIVWIVQAANLYSARRTTLFLAGNIVLLFGSLLYHHGTGDILSIFLTSLSFGLFQVFALGATLQAISERHHREETAALNRELIATRELLRQTSAQSERLRIARDLHDILGHHMTALILNLEATKHQLEGETRDKVEQSLALAKLLLSDLRSTVSELRDDDAIDLFASIDKLIAGVPELQVTLNREQAPVIKNVEAAETLLRCIQEGLTNVLRHSHARQCIITLAEQDQSCVLSLVDDGIGDKADIKPGNGLQGMEERLAALGGQLQCQALGDGFELRVQLPLESCQ